MDPVLPSTLLRVADLAKMFGVGTRAIHYRIATGSLPPPMQIGQGFFWEPQVIRDWLDTHQK